MIKTTIYKLIHFLFRKLCNLFAGSGLGSNKFIAQIYHSLLPRIRPDWVNINGNKIYLDKNDSLALSVFGVYEPAVGNVMKNVVKPGMTAIDIGANIGYFTIILSRLVGPNGLVYAFEPDPENYKILEKNLKANNLKNVIPVKAAIANKNRSLSLYVGCDSPAEYSIYNFIGNQKKVKVKAYSLDSYFKNKSKKIDFIKLDIQGAEGEAVFGARDLIKSNRKLMLLSEFWPEGMSKSIVNAQDYLGILENLGFRYSIVYDGGTESNVYVSRNELMKVANKCSAVNIFCSRVLKNEK